MLNRFKGCLLGMAIGDALGAPVEFLSLENIEEKYGEAGILAFDDWDGFQAGNYSDDTQLSLATAKGCIHAHFNLMRQGESRSQEIMYKRYLDWLESLKDPSQVRHPGYTCMNVLQSGERGTIENPINDSTEVSGLLRTAPAGLAFPPGMAFREGADYAALTHGHPSSYYAAGFFAEVIAHLVEEKALQDAVELSIEQLTAFDSHQDLLGHVEKALELFIDQTPAAEAIAAFGAGVTASEVLALGLYCSLKYATEFTLGLQAAVNHSGISTSCGLVTGAILGTLLGHDAIPEDFSSQVENGHEIGEVAEDMHRVFKQGERISFEKYALE
jgi:ADP-ribosylglycohydrolase